LVSLYRRAAQAEPVLDRKGEPTGEYRFDGPTARGCLELLGKEIKMFGTKGDGIAPSDVAALMQAVADRGKPPLPGDRARVVVDAEQAERAQAMAERAAILPAPAAAPSPRRIAATLEKPDESRGGIPRNLRNA
jgi:hypothetical protein